jgi:uncharacterized sulfatase
MAMARQTVAQQPNGSDTRPNIIVILIDDLGRSDLSCFGDHKVPTKHIDRLAAEGLRFSQFYVNSPICSPSRVAITTGQYPQRWRITSYLDSRSLNERRGMAQWLDPNAETLPHHLHDAGYATGHFGKWHMGGQRDVGDAPSIKRYGFDRSLTNFEGLGPRVLPMCDAHDGKPPRRHALGSDKLGRGPIMWTDRASVTKLFVETAIAFIQDAERDGQPFYVNLWPDDVHGPWFPPADRRGDGSKRALYEGVLTTMDEQLGALFDFIRNDDKRRANTIILLCSDNGPEPGAGLADPLRGNKGYLYEGGVRSPLIVWAPGFIDANHAGKLNDTAIVSAIDLVPSLLRVAGLDSSTMSFDGEDCSKALLGNHAGGRTKPLVWRRPPDRPPPANPTACADLAIRDGSWKLLCDYEGGQVELYNLDDDPIEATNVAERYSEVVARLKDAAVEWHRSMPADNGPTYVAR